VATVLSKPPLGGGLTPRPARGLLRPGWPLTAFFVGFPVWWALGLSSFLGPILALPMLASLARRGSVRAPKGFGIWALFLGWMLASALMLPDRVEPYIAFGFRASTYVAATVLFLYLYNLSLRAVPAARIADLLAVFWVIVALGGLAALVLPPDGFATPVELALPASLRGIEFVRLLVHAGLADVQVFLGYPVPRPRAPFSYTNTWGAMFALLAPFFIARGLLAGSRARRTAAKVLAVLSIVPVAVSLNRGLWLSLTVGLVYAAGRYAARGRIKALQTIIGAFLLVALIVTLSPLRGLLEDRFATPHSNDSRLTLYNEAILRVQSSPLLGFGSPAPTTIAGRIIPPVGTQGQFWLVLFSHGVPGALLFVAFFAVLFFRSRRAPGPIAFWANVTLLIALVQLPFYGMVPTEISVVFAAGALALRGGEVEPAAAAAPGVAAVPHRV